MNLGTEQHKKLYFEDIDKYRLPGDALLLSYQKDSSSMACYQ